MLGWELPPFNSGGLGVACFYLAKELNRLVDLTFSLPTKLPINQMPFKLIFADSFFKSLIKSYSSNISILSFINNETFDLVLTYGERLLQSYQEVPDIVHGHDWLTAPATIFLKNYFNVPSFIHVHSTEIERTGNNPNPIIFKIENDYFRQSDYLLPVSDLTKDVLIKIYHLPPEKIIVLPNGFHWEESLTNLPPYLLNLKKEGWQIVLFVGRITLQKGPDYLLRAIPLVLKFLPKTKFVFVGHGDMLPQLVKMSYELGISSNVIFTSFLRDNNLASIYRSADLLVVPSVADPFGLVPLEGLNHNIPVILSKTTGVGYYLNHSLKFDFWDTYELVNKIVSLLKYQKLHQTYLNNSRAEAKLKFDWSKTANHLYSIYQRCLQ
ncbi:MAG: glycosyltransferase family 4 protein [Patescibacteria group bacterium]|nr:glycosyltransferase family 4 protein [Patescibacteria group bacterium]